MAGGGGESVSSNAPPQYVQDQHQQNLNIGNVVADRPYQPYTGPRIADWTPDQQQAFALARGSLGSWQPFIGQAGQVLSDIAGGGTGGRGAGYDGVPIAGATMGGIGSAVGSTLGNPVGTASQQPATSPPMVSPPTRMAQQTWMYPGDRAGDVHQSWLKLSPDEVSKIARWSGYQGDTAGLADPNSDNYKSYAAYLDQSGNQGRVWDLMQGKIGITENVPMAVPQMTAAQIGSTAQMQAAQMNRGDIRDVTAGRFTDANLASYMNPFTQSVIDTSLSDLSRQNDHLNNATRARLAAAGAFGGSRGQIAETENNRNYLDTVARTSAGLNSQNFTQAQNAIGQDQNRALQAAGMNQGMDWNVTNGNANFTQAANAANQAAENARLARNAELAQQAAAANQGANLTLSQFDASQALQAALANQNASLQGNNQRLQAAQMLAGLGGQTQSLAGNDVNALLGIGSQQQGFNQANLDLAYQDFMRQMGYPQQQLQFRQGLLSGPIGSTTTQSTSTDNTSQLVGTGISAAATVAAAFM